MGLQKMLYSAIAAFLLLGAGFAPALAGERIQYYGSSTVGQYISDASLVYARADFVIDTDMESTGGENMISGGKGDLGGVAREVRPKITRKGVQKHLIGYDAIAVWVNEGNPVGNLTMGQLRAIFTGEITNWKEIGGEDLPVTIYIVNFKSATREVFRDIVLGGDKYWARNLKTIIPDREIIDAVASDRGGVGQLSIAFPPGAKAAKKITVDGQAATNRNTLYPIRRPLYLITGKNPKGHVKAFIDWTLSAEGQAVVRNHFIGIR
jgi:phosphate transport system substrate-binding protein